jgi:hypothetical protein
LAPPRKNRSIASLARTTQALVHGQNAFGARFVRQGFGYTPDDDLRFALGWPHLIDLVPGHLEDDTPIESALVALTTDLNFFRIAWGPETALRTIRGLSLEGPGLLGAPEGRAQLGRTDPLSPGEVTKVVREKLSSPHPQHLHRLMLLSEALLGPDPVIEGAFAAMRTWRPTAEKPLIYHSGYRYALEALGYLLLRIPAEPRARYLAEWQAMRESWGPEPAYSPITYATRAVLDPASVWTPTMNDHSLPAYLDAPAEVVAAWRLARRERSVGPIPCARMVFLGGDPVYEVSLAVWRKPPREYYFARGERARAMFEHFSPIRSPRTVALITQLASISPTAKVAKEWLARHAEDAASPA